MFPLFAPKTLFTAVEISQYSTTSNFTSGSSFEALESGNSYSLQELDASAKYSPSRTVSYGGGFKFGNSKSSSATFDRTNSGISDLYVNFQYKLPFSKVYSVVDSEITYPIYKVEPNSEYSLIGEGATSAQVGGWMMRKFWGLTNYTRLALKYQDGGRASLLLVRIGGFGRIDALRLGGEVNGFLPVTKDRFSNDPNQRWQVLNSLSGGSRKFYSVDPALFQLKVWGSYQFSNRINLIGSYAYPFNGENTGRGQTLALAMEWPFDLSRRTSSGKPLPTGRIRPKTKKETDSFKIQEEKYEEKLFEE